MEGCKWLSYDHTALLTGPKCEPVVKGSDCDHMTTEMLGCGITLHDCVEMEILIPTATVT